MTSSAQPDRFCDVVMQGGVTSGIVYPKAVVRLHELFEAGALRLGLEPRGCGCHSEVGLTATTRAYRVCNSLQADVRNSFCNPEESDEKPRCAVQTACWKAVVNVGRIIPKIVEVKFPSFALRGLAGLGSGALLSRSPAASFGGWSWRGARRDT
jgi:hypothetical protein